MTMSPFGSENANDTGGTYTRPGMIEPTSCPWCSSGITIVYHAGKCPKIKSIEYDPGGITVKRVEFFEDAT